MQYFGSVPFTAGELVTITDPSDGSSKRVAIPTVTIASASGAAQPAGSSADPYTVQLSGAAQFFTESTAALAASATFTGATRNNGGAAGGTGTRYSFFIAEAFSDVVGGTLYIDKSVDGGTTWRQVGSIAAVANSSVTLKVPLSAASYRARFVNGTTAQTAFLLTSAFSLN